MKKESVCTAKAPAAIGPYSQAVKSGGFLFTSGQLPIDPVTGNIPEGDIKVHTHQVLKNLKAIAEAAGTDLSSVVKATVYLSSMKDFALVNEVYAEYFTEPFPARSAFQVAQLPLGASVEVEAVFEL
ncbi:RidA family protein [Desulfobotulus sp. H1]|uniref:RidA family protein n=1 Tax=Desulfobotulus pelophilus TaxID=2823377 RepID=A0ABT3N5Y5_9BACT|nr:RidA family protein [Desulfobotulus pelophilus]MCW7752872.1 RidA family protein [Desulfobotulus pelophilus]